MPPAAIRLLVWPTPILASPEPGSGEMVNIELSNSLQYLSSNSHGAWPLAISRACPQIGFVTIHPVVQDISSEHDGDDDPFLTGSTHAAPLPRRCPLQPLLPFRPLSQTGTWAIFNATRETPVIPSSGPGETHVWAGATRLGLGVVESVSIHTYEAFRPDLPPSRVDQPPSAKGHRRSDASYPESRPQREHPTRQ